MAIFTGLWILDVWVFLASLLGALYLFYRHQFQFWEKRNVVHTKPAFIFGDMKGSVSSLNMGVVFKNIYDSFKGEPFFGAWMFFRPTLVLRDPELVKHVFVKDFMSFHDRGVYVNEKDDPLAGKILVDIVLPVKSLAKSSSIISSTFVFYWGY